MKHLPNLPLDIIDMIIDKKEQIEREEKEYNYNKNKYNYVVKELDEIINYLDIDFKNEIKDKLFINRYYTEEGEYKNYSRAANDELDELLENDIYNFFNNNPKLEIKKNKHFIKWIYKQIKNNKRHIEFETFDNSEIFDCVIEELEDHLRP